MELSSYHSYFFFSIVWYITDATVIVKSPQAKTGFNDLFY